MCNPAAAVMAVTAVYSGYQQNQVAKTQAKAAEETAAYNARVQENQATDIRNRGVEEENLQRRRTAELRSRQRAQLAASGVEIDSGSASLLQRDTENLGQADALRIRRNYYDQADAAERGATLTRIEGSNSATNSRNMGDAAMTGGILSAAGATAGAVADKWYTPKSAASQNGIPTNSAGLTERDFHSNSYQRSLRR